jgi:hypothetical protein
MLTDEQILKRAAYINFKKCYHSLLTVPFPSFPFSLFYFEMIIAVRGLDLEEGDTFWARTQTQ